MRFLFSEQDVAQLELAMLVYTCAYYKHVGINKKLEICLSSRILEVRICEGPL